MTPTGIKPADTEALWKEYHAALRRFIRRRISDEATADDLLQDVYIKVHSSIGSLKDRERVHAWLYRIARNTIIDYYRTRKLTGRIPEGLSDPGTGDRRILNELSSCVQPMIDRLAEPYREALILSELRGLTQKDIAEKQGISLPGAKSRVQRGRRKLKEMMLECCHYEFDRRGGIYDYERKKHGCRTC